MKPAGRFSPERLKKLDFRIVIVLAIFAYYAAYWRGYDNFTASIDHGTQTFGDFALFYYPAGRAVLENTPLPDGFYYSAFAAVLFVPIALFPPGTALVLWGIVQAALIVLLFLAFSRKIPDDPLTGYLLTFVFFTSAALLNNLKWGQVSTLLFWCSFMACLLYEQNKRPLSAAVLGIAIAIKYFPAVFLVYFLLKRDWKYVFLCAAIALACLLVVPALVMGVDGTFLSQLAVSRNAAEMVNLVAMGNIDSQYFASVITRIPAMVPFTGFLIAAGYAVTGFGLVLVYRISKADIDNPAIWAWAVLCATLPFWIPSAWPHYFVYLPFLQVLVLPYLPLLRPRARRPALVLWMFSLVFSSIFTVQAVQNWFRFAGFGSLFWSNAFLLILLGLALFMKLNREQAVPAPV